MDNVDLNKISTIDETPPKKNKFTNTFNFEVGRVEELVKARTVTKPSVQPLKLS